MNSYTFFHFVLMITEMYTGTSTESFYVLPGNSSNTSCPSHPCVTLSQYLGNISGMTNISFLFLSGNHSLTSTITMQQVDNITMIGVSYNNSAPAIIICNSAGAALVFTNASNIKIGNLVFRNCGGIGPRIIPRNDVYPDDYYPLPAALFFYTCYYCNVTNTTFIGYGLMINNLLGESHLDSITILITVEYYDLLQMCNQGIRIINTGENPYYVSHNLIYISKTIIKVHDNLCIPTYEIATVRIHLEPIDYNITLTLCDSNFIGINVQPVLLIGLFHGMSSRITFWIKDCKFENNQFTYKIRRPIVSVMISYFNVTLLFANCSFYDNLNKSPLTRIKVIKDSYDGYGFSIRTLNNDRCFFSNYIQIERCNFIRNNGPLVDIQGIKRLKCITRLSIIGPFEIRANKGIVMYIFFNFRHLIVNITGEAMFSRNSLARNIILFYYCTVTFHRNISFIENRLIEKIITLHSNLAYVKVMENTNFKFVNNYFEVEQHIEIKVENCIPYPFCVFQYYGVNSTPANASHALKNYIVTFNGYQFMSTHNNNDDDDDDDQSLSLSINYYTFHCQWLPETIFYGYHPADINKQIIQTDDKQMYQHTRVCYCFINNTYDCSLDLLGPVFPGQVLQIGLCVPHEFNSNETFVLVVETLNAYLPSSACKLSHQYEMINTISKSSNTYNFTIVSESKNECELFLTAQPNLYKIYDSFYVQLLPCPVGFTLQNGVCDCDPILSTIIDRCYIDYSAIIRPANSWIVAHTQTNNTKYFISNNCPMDYCLPYSSNVNLLYPDLQCQFNRTGMLCSQCQHSLSMVFASSRCMKCTSVHILITIIVIVAGIVLVVLLYVLNLTVTKGTINGIIFYANIVSINDSVFLVNDKVFKPLRVFISFANLDLGIETCFYDGMDSYAKMWLQLFFPSYLIIIAISIIIASRYSTRILRLTYRRSLPVLATLFLLSYTGVLRTVLTVLFSYSTITHLPSGHQQLVWSIDASVPLFGLKFTILFITCLVLFLILIPINLTLLFTRYLMYFRTVNHFKPLLDAFQGSYKQKYCYWVAVYLTLRSLFFTFYAFPTKINLICSTMLLIMFSVYSGYVHPNKLKPINVQELLLLINLTIMYAVSFQGKIFFIVANTMISLAFVQFAIIILYHFLTYTCHYDVIHMERILREKLMMKFCRKKTVSCASNNIGLLNIPECTYNYTEYRDGLVSDDFK